MNGRLFGVVLAAAMLPLTACAAATTPGSTAPAATVAAAPKTPTAPKTTAAPKTTTRPVTAVKVAKIKVPNGVGLDYQSAQDRWRAAGLHVLPAVDATGKHRLPVIDANWIVLSQDPKAGKKVNRGTFITATVKKSGE
jgi:beta-lactam-binding protein with PASTA domain